LIKIPPHTVFGFKATPNNDLDSMQLSTHAPTDWTAVYPQLNLQQAVAYLPNQWDRGEATACIMSLTSAVEVSILIHCDPEFTNGTLSSAEKAERLRDAYNASCSMFQLPQLPPGPLMTAFGSVGLVLCLPDAENMELVVPHVLFNKQVFAAQSLFSFEQSVQRPHTTGKVVGHAVPRSILADAQALGSYLTQRAAVTECTELIARIREAVPGLACL